MAKQTIMDLGLPQETLLVFVLAASTVVHASHSALLPCPIAALMRYKLVIQDCSAWPTMPWPPTAFSWATDWAPGAMMHANAFAEQSTRTQRASKAT